MIHSKLHREPYEMSLRFYHALQAKASRLDACADQDESFAASLAHPDHRRRHLLLMRAQREDAARLRSFLAQTQIRL